MNPDLTYPATRGHEFRPRAMNVPNTPPNPMIDPGPAVRPPLVDEDWDDDQEYVDPYWNSTYDDMAEWLEPSQQTLSAVPDVSPVQSTAFDYSVYGEPEFFQYWHHPQIRPFPHPYPSHLRPSIQTGYRQPLFGEAAHQNPLNNYSTFEGRDWGLEALAQHILPDHTSEADMQTQLIPPQDRSEQFISPQDMFTQFMPSDDIWAQPISEPDWPKQEIPAQVPTLNPFAADFVPGSTQLTGGSTDQYQTEDQPYMEEQFEPEQLVSVNPYEAQFMPGYAHPIGGSPYQYQAAYQPSGPVYLPVQNFPVFPQPMVTPYMYGQSPEYSFIDNDPNVNECSNDWINRWNNG